MEFPDLGKNCSYKFCKQLDFLPMKCDACCEIFCKDHVTYARHSCSSSYKKNVQVPVCPLCNKPVPVARGELPDIKVGEHIDRHCQSDPAVAKRKSEAHRCTLKGCKQKEFVDIVCPSCRKNFCLKHRHALDHDCAGYENTGQSVSNAGAAALSRLQGAAKSKPTQSSNTATASSSSAVNGPSVNEDEALALALQMSLNGATDASDQNPLTQEQADRLLAEALSKSEAEFAAEQRRQRESKKICTVA